MHRPPSASFDSMLRGRYFPGGPTPDGLDSDIMFKQLGDSVDPFQARNRRDSEEMVTDNRCRKYDRVTLQTDSLQSYPRNS